VASKIKAIALKKRVKAFLFNQTTEFEAIALKKSKEEKLLLHKKQLLLLFLFNRTEAIASKNASKSFCFFLFTWPISE
jgi:hypothetical protein